MSAKRARLMEEYTNGEIDAAKEGDPENLEITILELLPDFANFLPSD
jgi:hypothetical protein